VAIGKEAKFGDGLQRQWKNEEEEKERVNRLRWWWWWWRNL